MVFLNKIKIVENIEICENYENQLSAFSSWWENVLTLLQAFRLNKC